MNITKVGVEYGELRSASYPSFSNVKHGCTLEAEVEPNESAQEVRKHLHALAVREVKRLHGDPEVALPPEPNLGSGTLYEASERLVTDTRRLTDLIGDWASDKLKETATEVRLSCDEVDAATMPF